MTTPALGATVLFDAPGPRARLRYRIYTIAFAVVLVGLVAWILKKFNDGGQFESRIFEKLFANNVWNAIADGLLKTLEAAALGILAAVVVGFGLAMGRLSEHRWVRLPAAALVEFFRAVPLLLLIVFLFFFLERVRAFETSTNGLFALVVGLMLYNGAVLAEVFRAGINAVPKGQSEAAYAIGFRKTQVMMIVLVPQAVRFMLPAIISQCVVVLKDTSLGSFVVYPELVRQMKGIATFAGSSLMAYLLCAALFIAMNSVLSLLAQWVHRRSSRSPKVIAVPPEAIEDAALVE